MAQDYPPQRDMPTTDEILVRDDPRKADESNLQRGEFGTQGYGTRNGATGTNINDPAATYGSAFYGTGGGTFGATGTYGTTGDTGGAGYGTTAGGGTGTHGTIGTGGYGTGGGSTGYGTNFGSGTTTRRGAGGDRNMDKSRDA